MGEQTPANTTPMDVLNFWFGEDAWGTSKMSNADGFTNRLPLWWGFKEDMSGPLSKEDAAAIDADCRRFVSLVRAAGAKELDGAWTTPDGRYAQMLLCDQFSRNSLRGTPEAFAYDDRALELAVGLYEDGTYKTYTQAHWPFLLTPFQHSERKEDHEVSEKILDYIIAKDGLDNKAVAQTVQSCKEHKEVIDRFGRYPHRNKLKGRESTPEEKAWLADKEHLPAFALAYVD